jgi:hypothetical protein
LTLLRKTVHKEHEESQRNKNLCDLNDCSEFNCKSYDLI